MGSGLSKNVKRGSEKWMPPTLDTVALDSEMEVDLEDVINEDHLEPRSPHICRTPIHEIVKTKFPMTKNQNLTEVWDLGEKECPTSDCVREKFLKRFQPNLLDPRSPSHFINRTPLVFDEETNMPIYVDVDNGEIINKASDSLIGVYEKPFANEDLTPETPKATEDAKKCDPRSPSVGVERTPLVFIDDVSENEILESVKDKVHKIELQNKPLERIKNPRRQAQRTPRSRGIYEDKCGQPVNSTPKRSIDGSTPKRTPLSCVANKSHLRSKSVENSAKSAVGKVRVSSYDDYNLKGRHNSCVSGESPRFGNVRRLNV